MTLTDELRAEIAVARAELRVAVEGSAEGWERSPGGEEWSPRQIAEHAIRADVSFARYVAGATGQPGADAPREELSLPASSDALAALDRGTGVADSVWAAVGDVQLALPAPPMDSVEAAMRTAISHLREHAGQIAGG